MFFVFTAQCVKSLVDFSGHFSSMTGGCTHLVTAVINSIVGYEHMGPILAEILKKVSGVMTSELMAEIGQMNMADLSKSGNGVKNVGGFLIAFSEACPEKLTQHLPLIILRQIDSEIFQIRSAIIQVYQYLNECH